MFKTQSSRHLDKAIICSGVPTPTGQPVMQRMASLVWWMLPQRRSWHCATQQKSPMLPAFSLALLYWYIVGWDEGTSGNAGVSFGDIRVDLLGQG